MRLKYQSNYIHIIDILIYLCNLMHRCVRVCVCVVCVCVCVNACACHGQKLHDILISPFKIFQGPWSLWSCPRIIGIQWYSGIQFSLPSSWSFITFEILLIPLGLQILSQLQSCTDVRLDIGAADGGGCSPFVSPFLGNLMSRNIQYYGIICMICTD